jgi:putative DNA primase/helicase
MTAPPDKPKTFQGDLHNLPAALAPLVAKPNWVLWRWEWKKNKWDKPPYQPNGELASSTNPQTWSTYDEVVAAFDRSNGHFDGIGFVLDDDIGAFDVDDCRNLENGLLDPWSERLVGRSASYAEVTVGGGGIRVIGTVAGAKLHKKLKVANGVSCEIYRKPAGRYITVSGKQLPESAPRLANIDGPIDEVAAELGAQRGTDSDEDEGASAGGTAELPPMLVTLLHMADRGASQPHGGYPSRSELMLAIIGSAIRAGASTEAIVSACVDPARRECAVYEHCHNQSQDARAYAERQVKKIRKKIRDARSEMMTDLGNARRLVGLHGSDLRYVHAWHSWLSWEDGRWQRDGDGNAERMAKVTTEAMFAEAAQVADEARRTALRIHAIKSQSSQRLAAMVKLAESELEVILAVEKIDSDPYLLGLKNGVVDLRKVEFRETRRDDYVTKTAGTAFDARAECPEWEAFLSKIHPKKGELIAYLQRVTGYLLTGLTVEEVMFVLWGVGNNGKSTFRETVFTLMGDYAVGSDASLLITNKNAGGATPDVARLHGRRLITINETPQHSLLNEARVKFITGHDTITARNLYEEPFDFAPTHKTFLTTNHKPIVRDTDEGIWRRLHLLPFTEVIPPPRDRHFREKKLLPELPGILNWALEGLKAYWRDGLNPPQEVLSATREYREDMDIIGQWIEERCSTRNPAAVEKVAGLHRDYEQWSRGEIGFSMSVINFGASCPAAASRGRRLATRGPSVAWRW